MSQQINLYDPSLLRKRELLTAANLAAASAGLVLLLGMWGGVTRSRLGTLESENQALAPQVRALQEQKDAMMAQLSAMKPDAQLEAELVSARAQLDLHTKQVGELKKGLGAEAGGFAEYLRGFARQTPSGVWLTGFAIKDSGAAMEIRGRMLDPASLAEYIRRLDTEPAFKGREFAALKVYAGKTDAADQAPPPVLTPTPALPGIAPSPAAAPTPAPTAASGPPPFYEFALTPVASRPQGVLGALPGGVGRALTGGQP